MFKTLANAFKVKEIRNRIIFTFIMLIVVRIGSILPIPGINRDQLASIFQGDGSALANAFTGGALLQMSVFALSITPYITSSIIVQLLTIAIPKLEEMQKDGEDGRKKIQTITRFVKINELTNQKNTINAESERVQSAKNHLQDIIKGHKENIEKLNSEIEKIANEKEETQEKEKPSISFIVITVVLAIALICSIILIKNYIVSGILGVALIANIVFYVINKNKQKVNKAKLREKINQEKQYKREKLENQKQQIIANVNTTEKELEKQEEEEKQVNSELSMLKGQIILLEKNNEKITEEIEQDNKAIKEESNKNKQQIIEK